MTVLIKKKILLIGPLSPPITGVSICNEKIISQLSKGENWSIEAINTAIVSFNENIGAFSVRKVYINLKPYFFLYKIFKSNIVYVTIGQTFWGVLKSYPFLLLSKIAGKKRVIHVHGNYLKTEYNCLSGVKKKIFKKVLKTCDSGIVLSEKLKDNLTPFLKEDNIHIIKNFVDNDFLDISFQKGFNKSLKELKILYLSNLMTEKGIFDLLNALKILDQRGIEYEANLAGEIDKEIEKEIHTIINSLKNVKLHGVVKGKEKRDLLLQSNVFVLPTYYKMEGQPISILEAMATGNIIFTTNHAGISDIFSVNNGQFIKKRSPEDLAIKLEKVSVNLSNQRKIMIHNVEYAQEIFTEKRFIDSICEVFKKL